MIDIHCHLDKIKDISQKELLENLKKEKIKVITSSTAPSEAKTLFSLKEKLPDLIFVSLGLHPLEGEKMKVSEIEDYLNFIKNQKEKIVGLGEVGLDKYGKNIPFQKEILKKFLKLSEEVNLPLVLHCRGMIDEIIEILEKEKIEKVVFHCFCGNMTQFKKILSHQNWFISIATNIKKSKNIKKVAKKVPEDRFLLETDSPWLDPFSNELKNKPWNIKYTAKIMAEIRKTDEKFLLEKALENAKRIFNFVDSKN